MFFFIYPFLYENRHLGFSYMLFLCVLLPASIQFPDGERCSITLHGPGRVWSCFLFIFAVRLLKTTFTFLTVGITVPTTALALMQYRLLALQLAALYLQQH